VVFVKTILSRFLRRVSIRSGEEDITAKPEGSMFFVEVLRNEASHFRIRLRLAEEEDDDDGGEDDTQPIPTQTTPL
jgi:hypothetical protein